jgi:hypothetical protein
MVQFGKRMLQAQVPEWSDQYADYKGLKKMLKRMMKAQPNLLAPESSDYERLQRFPSDNSVLRPVAISVSAVSSADTTGKSLGKMEEGIQAHDADDTDDGVDGHGTDDDTVSLLETSITGGSDVRLQQFFFKRMDAELKKVETFYVAQRKQMVATLIDIEHQFDSSLEEEVLANTGIALDEKDEDDDDEEEEEVRSTTKPSDVELKVSGATQRRRSSASSSLFRPKQPKFAAKRQIKYALMELYKGLAMLHNFSVYNNTAFEKILKKHDKNMALKAREVYLEQQKGCSFAQDAGVYAPKVLQERCQHLYARVFTDGSRKEACNELDGSIGMAVTHPDGANLSTAGFFFGLSAAMVPLITAMLVAEDSQTKSQISSSPAFIALWPCYRVVFWVLLHVTGLGFCMQVWEWHKINYRFIFSFNPSTGPVVRPAFVMAAAAVGWSIALLWLLLELLILLDPCPSLMPPPHLSLPTLPATLLLGAVLTAVNPLPFLHRDARARTANVIRKVAPVPFSLCTVHSPYTLHR